MMGNGTRPPTSGAPIQAKIKINLNELPTKPCPICGCSIFNAGVCLFKELGAVRSPSGKAQLIQLHLASCIDCGAVVQPVLGELKLVEMAPKGEGEADGKG